jgi:hypothetical protein
MPQAGKGAVWLLFQRIRIRVKIKDRHNREVMVMSNDTKTEDTKKTYNNEDLKTTVPEHEKKDAKEGSKPLNEVMNGSMAPNMEEMKQLGKDMEGMKTGKDLKDEGLVPDPIQEDNE